MENENWCELEKCEEGKGKVGMENWRGNRTNDNGGQDIKYITPAKDYIKSINNDI